MRFSVRALVGLRLRGEGEGGILLTPLPLVVWCLGFPAGGGGKRPCRCWSAVLVSALGGLILPLGVSLGGWVCPGHWFLPPVADFRHARSNDLAIDVNFAIFSLCIWIAIRALVGLLESEI